MWFLLILGKIRDGFRAELWFLSDGFHKINKTGAHTIHLHVKPELYIHVIVLPVKITRVSSTREQAC